MRKLLPLLVLLLCPVTAIAATPSIVDSTGQQDAIDVTTHNTPAVTATAGDMIVFAGGCNTSSTDTYAVSDDQDGAWAGTDEVRADGGASTSHSYMAWHLAETTGDYVLTVVADDSSTFRLRYEVLVISNAAVVDVTGNGESQPADATPSFWDPAINMSADSIAIGHAQANASTTYTAPPTGADWEERWNTGIFNGALFTSINTAAVTSHTGTVTTSTARNYAMVALVLKDSGGSPSLVPILHHHKKRQGR